jgi:hypothetical protein
METPRLLSEYFAARAQSGGRISAKADAHSKKSNAKIGDAHRLPMSRRKKVRGGLPEPPGAKVTTRIPGD